MRILRAIGVVAAVLLIGACSNATDTCAGTGAFAVSAEIRDARTGQPMAYGGTVLELREDSYVERVSWEAGSPDSLRLRAGFERPGTYAVTVTRLGFLTWSRSGIRARRDECAQLQEVVLPVRLEPQAGG